MDSGYGTINYLKKQDSIQSKKNKFDTKKRTIYQMIQTRNIFYLDGFNTKFNFVCPICKHRSFQRKAFSRHMLVHDWTLYCPYCNIHRDDHDTLYYHILSKHLQCLHAGLYKCYICEKQFRDLRGLNRHYNLCK